VVSLFHLFVVLVFEMDGMSVQQRVPVLVEAIEDPEPAFQVRCSVSDALDVRPRTRVWFQPGRDTHHMTEDMA